MRAGPWKVRRTHAPAGDYQYKVARLWSDEDGASHVEDWQYFDTRSEAVAAAKEANESGR